MYLRPEKLPLLDGTYSYILHYREYLLGGKEIWTCKNSLLALLINPENFCKNRNIFPQNNANELKFIQ